jgi:uncharacterized protein (DUF2147 family)
MKIFHFAAASAALLLVSTAAQAGGNGHRVSFEIEGQKIRIDVPKHCDALSCIQISAPGLSKSSFNLSNLNLGSSNDDEVDDAPSAKSTPAPAAASSTPQVPATSAALQPQGPTPATTAASDSQVVASTTTAPVAPEVTPSAPSPVPAPSTATPLAAQSAAGAASTAPAVAANTPIGIWRTEEDKGNVRIEQCGANLCGYSVDAKSNANGEQVLINMRPGADHKWSGRIHDPNSGSTYDSTIAMKGTTQLRVQGCAFGGMFCGGQTWTRVN